MSKSRFVVFLFFSFSILGFWGSWVSPLYAAVPTVGTISPASGTTLPNSAKTFTCVYSDSDGWANLKEAYVLISSSSTALSNAVYLYYDRNANLLYLRNDTNTAWLGGYTPGSANTVENSQVKLDCAVAVVSGSVNTLSLSLNLSFKQAFSGKTYNTYLKAIDDTNSATALTKKGTYSINNPAVLGTISPASGTGAANSATSFTTTFTDPDGWANIQYGYLLINSSISGANCFYGYYNQNSNKLYLRNDANTAWLGGFAPGSANIIENSYAKLDCANTSVTGSDTTLSINWSVSFKAPFTGAKNTYLYVRDDANAYVTYTKKGTWTLPNQAPQTGAITPSFGASIPDELFNFTAVYTDPDTWLNLQYGYFLISGSSTALTNCFYAYYNQNTDKLYLRNDANTAWLGGYAPGSANIIENSYVRLDCAKTTVTGIDNTLTINWPVSFKSLFLGAKRLYLKTTDDASAAANWVQKGSWQVLSDGTIIGPNGGEVFTGDGRIKIVIPEGALSNASAIKISTVDTQTLENLIPVSTSLLNVAECLPYGLVFNKPVQIIYQLEQAEIPGTEVELGLYDSIQKKIISTGQNSVIPADGYSISFDIIHFSTYAALKNLIAQSAPIGAGVKIPLPDMLTGAYSAAILIIVAPGRKGIQPSVGLNYRSSNSNSWVGLGYSLNPGYIVRSTRLGPPSYIDTQDTYYLITDAGTTELVHLTGNLYQAKIESSFSKFFKETDDTWRVLAKDGSVLMFGETTEAKETSSKGTFSWYLTKAKDTNNNYAAYRYIKDEGKSYLSRIDYTGNEAAGFSPTNSVEFILESREDIASSYISTSKIAVTKRLKEILVKVSNDLVWKYVLEYAYSPDTSRSLLKSITQYGSDGKNMPAQTMLYQVAK